MTERSARPEDATPLMHVAILCPDVDSSLRFYREALGFSRRYEWTQTKSPAGQVVYEGRGVYLELGGHTYIELFPGGRDEVDSAAGPMHHIALIVPDVDVVYPKCLAAGGQPFPVSDWTGEPTSLLINGEPEMRVRVAFIKGPAGELIELYEQHSPVVAR